MLHSPRPMIDAKASIPSDVVIEDPAHEPSLLSKQTRRAFCAHACQALSLAAVGGALGAVLQGCGGGGNPASPSNVAALPTVGASDVNGTLVIAIDANSPLAAVGSAAIAQSPTALVLVARVGQDAFTALSSTCTHQACTITGFGSQTFVCPCHGSQFDTSGHVLNGPAPTSLRQFNTQFANNVLTISA
jgi:cytochrome b6-f complex iron-sulfur subunit